MCARTALFGGPEVTEVQPVRVFNGRLRGGKYFRAVYILQSPSNIMRSGDLLVQNADGRSAKRPRSSHCGDFKPYYRLIKRHIPK